MSAAKSRRSRRTSAFRFVHIPYICHPERSCDERSEVTAQSKDLCVPLQICAYPYICHPERSCDQRSEVTAQSKDLCVPLQICAYPCICHPERSCDQRSEVTAQSKDPAFRSSANTR